MFSNAGASDAQQHAELMSSEWGTWFCGTGRQQACGNRHFVKSRFLSCFAKWVFLVDTFGHVGSCLTWSVMRNGVDEKKKFGGLTKIGALVLDLKIAYVKIVLVGTHFSESRFFDVAS